MAGSNLTSATLATDSNAQGIQALAPDAIANAAVGAASAVTAIPTGAEIVEVATTTDSYIEFGTSGTSVASTTGMFFPKGAAVYHVPLGATHVAHIRASASGRITITKLI